MNNTLMKAPLLGLIGGMTLTLIGCGAVTDDTADTSSIDKVAVPSTPTAITAANQETVVAETANGVDGATSIGSVPMGASADRTAPDFSLFDFASGPLLAGIHQGLAQQQNLPSAIAISQPIPCDSGSMLVNFDVSDPTASTLQTGDSFAVTFSNCSMDGATSNGSMSASVTSGSLVAGCDASGTCTDFALRMDFNDLQVTEMGETGLIDGGFTLAYDSATITTTIRGDDLYFYASTGQGAHMSNFVIASTLSGNTETTTADMTMASTRIDGSVRIRTTTPLVTTNVETDDYPSSGVLQITGAGSTLTVTALDASSVRLELDADNDGTIDQDVTATWAEIEMSM